MTSRMNILLLCHIMISLVEKNVHDFMVDPILDSW